MGKVIPIQLNDEVGAGLYSWVGDGEANSRFEQILQRFRDPVWIQEEYVRLDIAQTNLSPTMFTFRIQEEVRLLAMRIRSGLEIGDFSRIVNPLSSHKATPGRNYFNDPFFKIKAGVEWEPYLRIYGIRYGEVIIIVTGGGVKVNRRMQDDEKLHDELQLLKDVSQLLKVNGIRLTDFTGDEIEL